MLWLCGLVLALSLPAASSADPDLPAPTAAKTEETNSQETLMSILRLQEQVHSAQLAIERNREEAQAAAARNTEALAGRLNGIEQALAAQRAKELEAIQSSNKVMLTVASLFGGLGCAAMLFSAFFQWRTIHRLAEISAALSHPLLAAPAPVVLASGDSDRVTISPAEQASQRLLGALERLEKRLFDFEHTTAPPFHEGVSLRDETRPAPQLMAGPAGSAAETETPGAARITLLLGKGQSYLSLDQNEAAIACFDQVLALDGNHPEALVKKGAALERLRRPDEAIACYDQAIAADGSMTVAYLYKGGLFNRLERFKEALECYESALRTQENRQSGEPGGATKETISVRLTAGAPPTT